MQTGYTRETLDPTAYFKRDQKCITADTIALLIDHNIQVPARFVDRVIRRKVDREKNPQAHSVRPALQHLQPSDCMTTVRPLSWIKALPRRNEIVSRALPNQRVHLRAEATIGEYTGMPTPTLTKERANESPRLPMSVNMNGTVSGDGNATIDEDCPYCGRLRMNMLSKCRDTGDVKVIFTLGRFLRWHPDSVESFQGIFTDVEKCHNVCNWEVLALILNMSQSCGGQFLSFQSRRSSYVSSAGGTTHGGCERTSMPSPIRGNRNMSYEHKEPGSTWWALFPYLLSTVPLAGPCNPYFQGMEGLG